VSSTGWWGRPISTRALVLLVIEALGVLVLAFAAELALRPETYVAQSDLRIYQPYGTQILEGAVPYRDIELEYPPGALPMFVLPASRLLALDSTEDAAWAPMNAAARRYHLAFSSLVLLLAAVTLVLTAASLAALRRPAGTIALSLGFVALSPLLIGDVFPGRYDIWPAALTAGALAASVRGRYRLGGALVGLGAAAKIYPALLLPVVAITAMRHRGWREGVVATAAGIGAAGAVFLPFAIASPSGTWLSLRVQFQSGLQIESVASSFLVVAGHLGDELETLGIPSPPTLTNRAIGGTVDRSVLIGPGVDATATVIDVLLAGALLMLWLSLLRSRAAPGEALVRYAAATVATALVLGKMLAPQYLIWLIPLVPLVGGRRGAAATVFLAVAAALTHVWFPSGYVEYENGLGAGPAGLLLARNLALLAVAAILLVPGAERPRPSARRIRSVMASVRARRRSNSRRAARFACR
jgi:glycosyl transferase family 87